MNEKIISFILCINDDSYFTNSRSFIEQLSIPKGYRTEIIQVRDAKSLTGGYNEGMKKAKGKYKVYLHQDVYIINPKFIENILDIFKDESVGLIGMAGSPMLTKDGIWWNSTEAYGMIYEIRSPKLSILNFNNPTSLFKEVDVVDGLMLITQYDTPWRDDIFDGWHFYDSSQCMEFKRISKKVVVPLMFSPWCIHDCGVVSISNFEYYRLLFLEEYKDLLPK